MFEVATYSPTDVQLVISGYAIQGWNTLSISRTTPEYKMIRGIRGKHTRARSQDTSCSLIVSLSQSSPTNDVFSMILDNDRLTGNGKLKIILKDSSGSSRFESSEAYITGYPTSSYSDGFESRDWTIFCQESRFHVGGNSNPPTEVVKTLFNILGI